MTTTQHSVGTTTTFNQYQQGQPSITRSVPKHTMDTNSLEATNSFDSVAEMSQYFPQQQHADSSSIGHQQGFEGQTYSTATTNRVLPTNINAINAASHVSVASFPSTLNQHQPIQTPSQPHVRPPNMAHQQGAHPSASRPAPTGIPSYESQVEGLSVDQTLVNEVLVNIQSKLINENLQDYGETGHDIHLEPIQPIHIQAPQPTLVLQSDYNRLRAELNSRVRPPVVYRYPANANSNNQYQQHTSQHTDTQGFQDNFGPTNFGHSDEYRTSSTTYDEQRREKEERLHNQAESVLLNTDNVNDNVHGAFERQGLSTISSDRHASSYPSSSFFTAFEDNQSQQQQQQGKNQTIDSYTKRSMDYPTTNVTNVTRSRQEVTFDIDNCIARCFEAHRQRVARRRAAKQARKARRHRPSNLHQRAQRQFQQHFDTIETEPRYSTLRTTTIQPLWEQTSAPDFSTIISQQDSQTIQTSENYDYSGTPSDYLQQTATDFYQGEQQVPAPFYDTQSTDYYNYQRTAINQPHLPIYTYPNIEQQQTLDFTDQSVSSTEYFPSQTTQPQGTFEYTKDSYQLEEPIYTYQGLQQTVQQYPYSIDNLDQQQTYDFSSQTINSPDYYQEQTITGVVEQVRGATVQPSGTIDYTEGLYPTQQSDFNYQGTTDYSYDGTNYIPQPDQTNLYPYDGSISTTGQYSIINDATQVSSFDGALNFNKQTGATSTTSYPDQSIPQLQGHYTQPNQTFEYTQESYHSQQPIYNYDNLDQQVSQHVYDFNNLQQQDQTNIYSYDTEVSSGAYPMVDVIPSQDSQYDAYAYTNQIQNQSDQYEGQIIPSSEIQTQIDDHQIETAEKLDQGKTQTIGTVSTTSISKARIPEDQIRSRQESNASSGTTGAVEYSQESYYIEEPITEQDTIKIQGEEHETIKEKVSDIQHEERISEVKKQTDETGVIDIEKIPSSPKTKPEKPLPPIIHEVDEKSESQSTSHDNTSSSLLPPPPPPSLPPATVVVADTDDSEHHQDSIATDRSDFPPPPPPAAPKTTTTIVTTTEHQTAQEKPTKIPITEQSITFHDDEAQTPPSRSDSGSEDDSKIEEEEYFDLRQCIVRCYERYRESWDQMQEQPYREHTSTSRIYPCDEYPFHPHHEGISTRQITTYPREQTIEQHEQPQSFNQARISHQERGETRPYHPKGEIHYTDAWTQTQGLGRICEELINTRIPGPIPTNFRVIPHVHQFEREETGGHFEKPQSIEFSPPLLPQTRQIRDHFFVPTSIPHINDQIEQHDQQQQTIFDHSLPVPPHLSFNDNIHQPDSHIQTQIISQPRPYYETRNYRNEEQQQQQRPQPPIYFDEQQQRHRAHSEPPSIHQETVATIEPLQTFPSPIYVQPYHHPAQQQRQQLLQQREKATSIPMLNFPVHEQVPIQPTSVRMVDQGRSYELDSQPTRRIPIIDQKTGQCLVPCPEAVKYAHLPSHLRPELFCIELPPPGSLPPPPPPPPQPFQEAERADVSHHEEQVHQHVPHHHGRWCVRCCCVPGRSLIKKVVYRKSEGEKQAHDESYVDYASVIDQMATQITVRYGNSYMEEGEAFVSGGYNEQLRVLDFPVYVSGQNDPNLTPLVPT